MAQPCASTCVGRISALASSAARTSRMREPAVRMSVEIHKGEEERPQAAHEVPVDGAHLEPGVAPRGEVATLRQDGDGGEPQHGHQHVHRVAADEEVEGPAIVAAAGGEAMAEEP